MSSDSPAWVELRAKTPADWEVALLAEVTDFQEGPGILAKDFAESGVPLLRLRNIEGPNVRLDGCNYLAPARVESKWKHFALAPGDLLISTSASLGRVSVVDASSAGAIAYTGIIRFRSRSQRLHHEYLRAFLSSKSFVEQAERMATGSVIKHFGPSHLRQMAIALPPIGTQVRIAELFDALDDRITLLRETNATLEAIAQALFKSWFVDFDPVRAKCDGRAPEGMDEATATLFPDSFEDSKLGAVPRGWLPRRLDSFLELAYGKALKAEERQPGRVPVYGSGGITGWHDTALVSQPSIVVGRKGTVGSVYWESRPFFPIDTVFYVKSELPLTYCFELLKTLGLKDMNTDAAVPGLNRENVYRLLTPAIPADVLDAFDALVGSLRARIDQNDALAETLSTLRDTLLPRLISGQLRLPEAAETIAAEMA